MTCMTGSSFAYASAQAVCAVSACSEASSHANIAMILDVSLLLASIIILPIIILVHHFPNPGTTPGFPFDPLKIGPETPSGSVDSTGPLFCLLSPPSHPATKA